MNYNDNYRYLFRISSGTEPSVQLYNITNITKYNTVLPYTPEQTYWIFHNRPRYFALDEITLCFNSNVQFK